MFSFVACGGTEGACLGTSSWREERTELSLRGYRKLLKEYEEGKQSEATGGWTRNSLQYAVNFAVQPSAEATREFINVALGFSPQQYAFLASYGFTLLYTFASLIAGRVADTVDRGKTLSVSIFLWHSGVKAFFLS
ncbi:hypothetical protein GUITHDRAFT_119625 [Guillardia theta CCMP2712]|uniref:Major facilitator superfamily (MFS) profile domain-containing protein n=1 Tax=Guillardia theta (strain CCMP2712) TaxID=905079 RepID=L1ID87_GUITC|nr:hypothetical protein GUITHDRAFT_119625 [Guillardia theta CCMP2712]EKX34208.1 hypothetical protein GUITHDRAFT_119625 [Guillardia theta CCMP2712]|eukprot:XP_005821188.1 hypothetical protein GUITHDRAFT_119625 [Guillardia theta CCMP2712]